MTPPQRLSRKAIWLLPLLLVIVLAVPVSASIQPAGSNPAPKVAPAFQSNNLTWQAVSNSPGVFWYTVYFPTPTIGYALGGPDWNVNDGIGPAYLGKTTDGGATWNVNLIPNTNRFMRGLACSDANSCWISGASTNKIMFTLNGGASWQNGVIANNAWNGWLWSTGWTGVGTTILTGTTGYCPDGDPDPNCPNRKANILRSSDGVVFFPKAADDPREFVVYDFSCPVPGTCYAAAKQTAFYSGNNGDTWFRKILPIGRYFGIWCTNANTCWEVGGNNGGTNDGVVLIYRTIDGGNNWQPLNTNLGSGGRPRLYNVQMVDSQRGYAVGCTNAPDPIEEICTGSGLLMRTTDGISWQQIPSPSSADLMDLWVHDMGNVIVVDFAGKIWRGSSEPTPTPTSTNTPTPTATPTRTPSPTPSTGQVVGVAFNDANGNLLYDAGETGLGGASLQLKQGPSNVVYSTTSQPNGSYSFPSVAPGQYTLFEAAPPAGFQPVPAPYQFTFEVTVNTTWRINIPYSNQPTATPTATLTATPTATATTSPTPTAQPTATATFTPDVRFNYVPMILKGSGE